MCILYILLFLLCSVSLYITITQYFIARPIKPIDFYLAIFAIPVRSYTELAKREFVVSLFITVFFTSILVVSFVSHVYKG